MASVSNASGMATIADLVLEFGPLPIARIHYDPLPGSATELDVVRVHDRENRLCELVDGVLVEKTMGFYESRLAVLLSHMLQTFLDQHDLGILVGADGMMRIAPGMVRIPDVAFISWQRLPNRSTPREAIPDLVPDLAVEVLSPGNTDREMERKLRDYFAAGVRLAWYVDPAARSIRVYQAADQMALAGPEETVTGGTILPNFKLSVKALFSQADRAGS